MKKKGNISLLVLFILVACSLLGIIAVQYTRHMAIQTSQIYNYYKTYYLAKGGSEIGLSLMQLRGAGYSWEIKQDDLFVEQNIRTGNAFSLKIQGDNSLISENHPDIKNCINGLVIPGKQSLILPLFTDTTELGLSEQFTEQNFYKNKSDLLKLITITGLDMPRDVGVGIIISSGGMLSELGIFFTSGSFGDDDFFQKLSNKIQESFNTIDDPIIRNRQLESELQNYLIIANKEDQELRFCLSIPNGTLALPKTYISSFGYAGTKKMGLETVYQQPIPSYLIDSSLFQGGE
ncbi:hypothetical protein P148_SR1C00001G0670 [candidate division SR1 bacterium RAAC1_SR1_1]|nr:hypothetical protein P148_SR1C00001G0670 [candidate division SR1 bacterium RAAC1_SR1_1]